LVFIWGELINQLRWDILGKKMGTGDPFSKKASGGILMDPRKKSKKKLLIPGI